MFEKKLLWKKIALKMLVKSILQAFIGDEFYFTFSKDFFSLFLSIDWQRWGKRSSASFSSYF